MAVHSVDMAYKLDQQLQSLVQVRDRSQALVEASNKIITQYEEHAPNKP